MKWMGLWSEAWRKEEDLCLRLRQKLLRLRISLTSQKKCRRGRKNYRSWWKTSQRSSKRKKHSWNLLLKILSKWGESFNQCLKTWNSMKNRPRISEICSTKPIPGTTCLRIEKDKLKTSPQKSRNSKKRNLSCRKHSRDWKMSKRREKLRQSSN